MPWHDCWFDKKINQMLKALRMVRKSYIAVTRFKINTDLKKKSWFLLLTARGTCICILDKTWSVPCNTERLRYGCQIRWLNSIEVKVVTLRNLKTLGCSFQKLVWVTLRGSWYVTNTEEVDCWGKNKLTALWHEYWSLQPVTNSCSSKSPARNAGQ